MTPLAMMAGFLESCGSRVGSPNGEAAGADVAAGAAADVVDMLFARARACVCVDVCRGESEREIYRKKLKRNRHEESQVIRAPLGLDLRLLSTVVRRLDHGASGESLGMDGVLVVRLLYECRG